MNLSKNKGGNLWQLLLILLKEKVFHLWKIIQNEYIKKIDSETIKKFKLIKNK